MGILVNAALAAHAILEQSRLAWKEMCDKQRMLGDDSGFMLYVFEGRYVITREVPCETAVAMAPVGGYDCLDDLVAALGETVDLD